MVKKKVSLGSVPDAGEQDGGTGAAAGARAASVEVLELFFNTGIVMHEVALPRGLPDVVSSFMLMKNADGSGGTVRRAQAGEEPDVEISATDHLGELANRWLPVPYQ